ncbi:general odorant-binding protein 66-like [Teleopsis dalmanni]|uniref:general odorant-binding protein 66-like n=1 Tax=Teleopsis dalmanni TaxID=139649 RepID=UPI0018CCC74D|nr:general odorant-binding protein 66-like [Teleopsis dalmanni]XP_037956215.1 general odorant-binding protein 66-like [Teleopsis dalmanni]
MWTLKPICVLIIFFVGLTVSIKVRCNHPETIREDHIHYCCKHPDGHNDIIEMCANETKFKLPSKDEEALEDVTVAQLVAGTCFGKCVFQKFKFFKNHELDMNAVRQHYKEVHKMDPEYEREMISAFDHCHSRSEEETAKLMSFPFFRIKNVKFCDPKPSVVLSCVIYNFFHNCPKDRWAKTKECEETLEFAKKCKDALISM